jgi:trk system potassium uptake protein
MRYIIIGLGRFGSKLASILTEKGHEVIGIDHNDERLEELKDTLTTVIKMDSTNLNPIRSLPLDDIDAAIVAIGEDIGASILTLAILKSLKVSRIIGRAISHIHYDILKQIGVDEIVLPLEESAWHVSSMLQCKNTLKLTEINDEYSIAEVNIPSRYAGHSLDTVNIGDRFGLRLIAVKSPPKENIITTILRRDFKVVMDFDKSQPLSENDILVLAGRISDINRFVES